MIEIGTLLQRTTLELCQIGSITKNEGVLAQDIFSRLKGLGNHLKVRQLGNAVIAEGPYESSRKTFTLLGHLDTVPPFSNQKLGIFLEEGRIYGCGASDMKGGLAVMLALLQEIKNFPQVNIRCIFYDKEEGPLAENGLTPLIQQGILSGTDFGICLEPTDNQIQAGCLGGLQATVTFFGKRAHSARPWQGENAIYKALPFLNRLKNFGKREILVEGLPFYEVMNPTMAQAGIACNVIPDRFVLNVNYRFAPSKSSQHALQELVDLVQGEGHVEVADESPSGEVCSQHPLIAGWQKQLNLEVVAKQAWTDVAQVTNQGIPAINFGPGETAQAHQENEFISIPNLEKCYLALRALFLL